jgi:hypothetical protein
LDVRAVKVGICKVSFSGVRIPLQPQYKIKMEPKDIRERIIKEWLENEIINIDDIIIDEIQPFTN